MGKNEAKKQQHKKTRTYLSDERRKVLHDCFSKVLPLKEVQGNALQQMPTNGVSPNLLLSVHLSYQIDVEHQVRPNSHSGIRFAHRRTRTEAKKKVISCPRVLSIENQCEQSHQLSRQSNKVALDARLGVFLAKLGISEIRKKSNTWTEAFKALYDQHAIIFAAH
jgi:hypothetical protein